MAHVPERRIVSFSEPAADAGDRGWVAALSCGHRRDIRHRPPAEVRPWVLDAEGRASHLGSWIECPECEDEPEGGEMVCYAELICPECGTILDDTHAAH